jgi:hypothetical protein
MVYRLIEFIKNAFLDEPFCNTVTEGSIFDVDLSKQTIFPLTHIMINNATHQGSTILFNVSILLIDLCQETDKIDIWNNQLALGVRVMNLLNRGDLRTGEFELSGQPSFEPFTERFENDLAGWSLTFDIVSKNDITIC